MINNSSYRLNRIAYLYIFNVTFVYFYNVCYRKQIFILNTFDYIFRLYICLNKLSYKIININVLLLLLLA